MLATDGDGSRVAALPRGFPGGGGPSDSAACDTGVVERAPEPPGGAVRGTPLPLLVLADGGVATPMLAAAVTAVLVDGVAGLAANTQTSSR